MNRNDRIRVALLLSMALAFACSPAAAAADGDGGTLFVNHSASPSGAGSSCAIAKYSTVQSAVDAARPGQTVYLCGTTPYQESVLVQKNLKLTGDPGAAIQAPTVNSMPNTTFFSSRGLYTPNSVLTVIGKFNVEVNGLIIEGPFTNTDCNADDFGVLQINGGELKLNHDQVLHIRASNPALGGCQYGVGIQIGRRYWPNAGGPATTFSVENFVGDAAISNTTVSDYQKNGITIDGPGSEAHVRSSTIDGGGQTPVVARNGIQISRGATGEVDHNAVNNNEYTGLGAFASATGVLVFGGCGDPLSTNVDVHENTLSNNDSGVVLANYTPDPNCVASATTPTDDAVHNNTISKSDGETNHSPFTDQANNPYTGYQVGIGDTGNNDDIHNNTITGTGPRGADTAFGPQTSPGGPFLAPIDIQTYPPIHSKVHDNTYDGAPTNPPY